MESIIKNAGLAGSGKQKIEWARRNMPLCMSLEEEFKREKPFNGMKLTVSVHLEAKTAYLAKVLAAGGAVVAATGSNPLSTQDDVAAGLAADGIGVFAWHGATAEEYAGHIEAALSHGPNLIIDDGGDLARMMHTKRSDLIPNVIGGCEETTTGVLRLKAMEREGVLKFPMVAVNDAQCKFLFDNRYGTGQSVWDGVNRTTNLIAAGKRVVIAGYGWCGKGVALRAKGLGAKVIVTEIDPIKSIEAVMDGFDVMKMDDAARVGDLFITVTGCRRVIYDDHFKVMKDGAVMCNAGHFDVEVYMPELREMAVETAERRNNITGYKMPDGRWLNVLAMGRLVNLAAGDGHPAEIMDLSFALQALCAEYIAKNGASLKPSVVGVPEHIDRRVADMRLKAWNITIDTLTDEQKEYLAGWA